jgi:hypothetical protein
MNIIACSLIGVVLLLSFLLIELINIVFYILRLVFRFTTIVPSVHFSLRIDVTEIEFFGRIVLLAEIVYFFMTVDFIESGFVLIIAQIKSLVVELKVLKDRRQFGSAIVLSNHFLSRVLLFVLCI